MIGRLVALVVLIAMLSGIAYVSRDRWNPPEAVEVASTGNPELDACLAERVGAVDTMLRDGVITEAQFDQFRGRAVNLCESQFPRP